MNSNVSGDGVTVVRGPVRRRPRAWRVAATLVLALAVGGCVPWYDGTPTDFYDLPEGGEQAPGTLVRVQKWAEQSNASTNVYRVAYWTKDRRDRPVKATGVVRVPTATAPTAGTAIGAWDHGTTGLAAQCAPSRTGASYSSAYLPAGVPVAIPDYIGLGPDGEMHAWLAGVSEARATIDLVRAARFLPNVRHNGDWWVAGHSQGGHAALFSGEHAESYAPELDLQGVIAIAPGTKLNEPSYVTSYMKPAAVMTIYGLQLDYPETIQISDYATPAAEAQLGVLESGCLTEITAAYVGMPQIADVDPWQDQELVDLLVANEPGHAGSDVPVLVVQGGTDFIVLPAYTREYAERACAAGTTVKLSEYPDADHSSILGAAATEASQWIATVSAGQAPPTSC